MLHRMPDVLDAEAASGTDATIQYDISEPVYQVLKAGELTVHDGRVDEPDLTIEISDDDLVKLFSGELNAAVAFMSGQVKLRGDMMLAQKLAGFVDQSKVQSLADSGLSDEAA